MALPLPMCVLDLTQDCVRAEVKWEQHSRCLNDRILAERWWSAIVWRRRMIADDALREHLPATLCRHLSARQLRFRELLLDLAPDLVTSWLAEPGRPIWDRRSA